MSDVSIPIFKSSRAWSLTRFRVHTAQLSRGSAIVDDVMTLKDLYHLHERYVRILLRTFSRRFHDQSRQILCHNYSWIRDANVDYLATRYYLRGSTLFEIIETTVVRSSV